MHRVTELFARRIEATGYSYPAVYLVVAYSGVILSAMAAVVQRIPHGLTWPVITGLVLVIYTVAWNLAFGTTTRFGMAIMMMTATSLLLTTPVSADVAPVILVVCTAMVSSTASVRGSLLAAVAAATIIVVASVSGHLDNPFAYLVFVGFGWTVGYMFLMQLRLLTREQEAADSRSEQAAIDERQRIAREVHDVIAHSLSITLLNLTGARRALQEDRDIDEAIDNLADAERVGRQAMADIRHTVKVLDSGEPRTGERIDDAGAHPSEMSADPTPDERSVEVARPEPGIDDIADLVMDFRRANLSVGLWMLGDRTRVSATTGLALYRIAQESLANFAKHSPTSHAEVTVEIAEDGVRIRITNSVTVTCPDAGDSSDEEGSGLRGMARRAELLGGTLTAETLDDSWVVVATFPPTDDEPSVAVTQDIPVPLSDIAHLVARARAGSDRLEGDR
ncbi:sensor histidine kinase [Gordonia soli]|uniref:histidine kinase n=1 Tax=Gordonia soli NBRC 108243 TaxID=1223545 RepID=M0QH71_9ACTN|nr:histidine kinase [Gordonia soli]GAC67873.1 putative two-component histidine kinase [Gordonia soli NBRC 108243]